MGILLTDVHGDNLQCRISVSFEASSAMFALELNSSALNCKNTERPFYNPAYSKKLVVHQGSYSYFGLKLVKVP